MHVIAISRVAMHADDHGAVIYSAPMHDAYDLCIVYAMDVYVVDNVLVRYCTVPQRT